MLIDGRTVLRELEGLREIAKSVERREKGLRARRRILFKSTM